MREELLRLKLKSGDAIKRSMAAMLGGQASLLLKNIVTNWRDELATLRQERMVERLKEENLRLKGKSDESMRRAMSMMMGGQASLVIKEVFVGWHELVKRLIHERCRAEFARVKLK